MGVNLPLCMALVRLVNDGTSVTVYDGKVPVSGYIIACPFPFPQQILHGLNVTVTLSNAGPTILNPGEAIGVDNATKIDVKAAGQMVPVAVCLFYTGSAPIAET